VLSITDKLTGLYNRRYLEDKAKKIIIQCERYEYNLILLMIDIDYFKLVNDNFGHDIGDEVLIEVAKIIISNVRKVDISGRWGGEEFVVLLQCDLAGADILTKKLHEVVSAKNHKKAGKVTISIGLTKYVSGDNLGNLIKRADQALYIAKENGRNRIEKVFLKV